MTLTELQNEVYTLTNRPDLVAQTLAAVRAATLKAHHSDFFFKDLVETGVVFSTSEYLQQLEYRTIFPLWRAIKYLRKSDSTGTEGPIFTILTPEDVLDSYKIDKTDVLYMAGATVQIKSSTEFQYAMIGYYKQPDIAVSTYDSWIALDHPYAIIYEAAATVLKMIGKDSGFTSYSQLALLQFAEIKLSNILAQGY
jgi:hypothetical protein